MQAHTGNTLWCDAALLPEGWATAVEICSDADGDILSVTKNTPYRGGEQIMAPVIPGMPNIHSHAHQRAMAGLAERTADGGRSNDNF